MNIRSNKSTTHVNILGQAPELHKLNLWRKLACSSIIGQINCLNKSGLTTFFSTHFGLGLRILSVGLGWLRNLYLGIFKVYKSVKFIISPTSPSPLCWSLFLEALLLLIKPESHEK